MSWESFDLTQPPDGNQTFGTGAPIATGLEVEGDSYIDLLEADAYIFNGTSWVLVGGINLPGFLAYYYENNTGPITSTSGTPTTFFTVTPGLPSGDYLVWLNCRYFTTNSNTAALINCVADTDPANNTSFQAGSGGVPTNVQRVPGSLIQRMALTPASNIRVELSRPVGTGSAGLGVVDLGIFRA